MSPVRARTEPLLLSWMVAVCEAVADLLRIAMYWTFLLFDPEGAATMSVEVAVATFPSEAVGA